MNDVLQHDENALAPSFRDKLRSRELHVLEANSGLSQRRLTIKLCVSVGVVNYELKAPAEMGFVKAANFPTSVIKVAKFYTLAR